MRRKGVESVPFCCSSGLFKTKTARVWEDLKF